MKTLALTLAGLVLLASFAFGCTPKKTQFSGKYAFLNKSGINAYQMTTRGFSTIPTPGAGRFEKGAAAYMDMQPTDYPDRITVLWGYKENGSADQSQVVNLKAIPQEKRKGYLVLEFHPNKKWTARFDTSEIPR